MADSMSSSANRASGPSMSLDKGAAPGGVGNYKGVMLCNRPFAGSVANKNESKGGSKATFSCGLVPEPAGINVSLAKKDQHKVKRPKKETVLTKHRRWLAELQKTKDKLEMQYIEEIRAKEASKEAFQDEEKKMRRMAKELLNADEKDADAKGEIGPETRSPRAEAKPAVAEAKKVNKPAWAQTEQAASKAVAASEDKELADEEDLLDFAQNLDYDRFIGDIEVQTMMKRLKERIASLEREVKDEVDREMDAATRAMIREKLSAAQDLNELVGDDNENAEDEDIKEIAKLVLEEDSDMKAVHSQASVQSMLKLAKDKIATVKQAADAKYNPSDKTPNGVGKVSGGPQIVVHEPSEGTRIDGKNTVSNLPYMHRNPAV
jgi:hypothetical protein